MAAKRASDACCRKTPTTGSQGSPLVGIDGDEEAKVTGVVTDRSRQQLARKLLEMDNNADKVGRVGGLVSKC